jgi:cell wall-associated NlpC family hydrolase
MVAPRCTVPRSRPGLRAGRLFVLLALAVLLAAVGCAPKRVIRGSSVTARPAPAPASAPTTAPSAAPDRPPASATSSPAADLPPPVPRGLAGIGVPERLPASLTFGARAAALASEQLGKPYQWGASGPDRFDCSGLVQHVYGQLGVALPRVSEEQARVGREVRRSELQAGDLVFFATNGRGIDHVGIYVGGGEFIHAPNSGTPVSTESLAGGWWHGRYRMARRIR